jgi:predicted MFS family arabinose efflux permease
MQDCEAQDLLNHRLDWRSLFICTGIVAAFSLLSLMSIVPFQ